MISFLKKRTIITGIAFFVTFLSPFIVSGSESDNKIPAKSMLQPVISGTYHAPNPPMSGEKVVVAAKIESKEPISSVDLVYKLQGGNDTTVKMETFIDDGDTLYWAMIPHAEDGIKVEYYVMAKDSKGGETSDPPDPDSKRYSYTVDDSQMSDFVSIAQIQKDLDGDGESDMVGQSVKVRGVVTIGNGKLREASWGTDAYMQDYSGRGINLFWYDPYSEVKRQAFLEIEGEIDEYQGKTELKISSINLLSRVYELTEARYMSTKKASSSVWDGTFIHVVGMLTNTPSYAGGGYNLYLDDDSGEICIRIWDTTGIKVAGMYNAGDLISSKGVGSVYNGTYQILTAHDEDIEKIMSFDFPPNIANVQFTPVLPGPDDDVTVKAKVTDDSKVSQVFLFYLINDEEELNKLEMTEGANNIYTATIPKQPDKTRVRFYIYAEDDMGNSSIDPVEAPDFTYEYYSYSDRAPVVYGSYHIPPVPDSASVVTVYSKAGDDWGLENVRLRYKISSAKIDTAVVMTLTQEDSLFRADIPRQREGAVVKYYVIAEDTMGQKVTDPEDTLSTWYSYTVNSEDVDITPMNSLQKGFDDSTVYMVEGVVTAPVGTINFDAAYIQDSSGRGLKIDLTDAGEAVEVLFAFRGNYIRVSGYMINNPEDASGEGFPVTRMQKLKDVKLLAKNQPVPEPVKLLTAECNNPYWEGTLVQSEGVVEYIDPVSKGGGMNSKFNDGSGVITLRIIMGIGIEPDSLIEHGKFNVKGILGPYLSTMQLMPAFQHDLKLLERVAKASKNAQIVAPPHPFAPEIGEALVFSINAPLESKITLRVYNLEGREIATLASGTFWGTRDIMWTGRDRLQRLVPIGTYILFLEAVEKGTSRVTTASAPAVVGAVLK